MMPKAKGDPREQLNSRLIPEPNTGCLLWTGCVCRKGYGQIKVGGRKGPVMRAHRLAWELEKGPVPDGLALLHKCDVPSCCNTDHLRPGTLAQNNADMKAKGRASRKARFHSQEHPRALLTNEDIIAIRADTRTQAAIGAQYGIGQPHISAIKLRRIWKHVA